ncbi:hypothetical protein [Arundinibacter roseus]|uniref:Uncharacterized protein n=1 Tax=Arundinibacter roseus TaxID=2070510 RepID=A0A4R4K337_9BACT|nr:hypothetical protein [Arundinibacter roseus]TDB61764.1 hypothetical protein EZE20_18620 [Arundinibacter roseus]
MPLFPLFLMALFGIIVFQPNKKPLSAPKPELQKVVLTEFTRGTQRHMEFTATHTILRLNDRDTLFQTSAASWKKLRGIIKEIPLKNLNSLEIISKNHQVDAAMHATLTIQTSSSVHQSPTFDHNAPPESLHLLVNFLHQELSDTFKDSRD